MRLPPAIALAALALAGCTGPAGDSADGCPTTAALTDADNYTFEGALDVASVDVQAWTKAAPVHYTVDWSTVTTDLQGHALDPVADIDMVTLVAFGNHTQEEVEQKLADNTLLQQDISGYASTTVGTETSVPLGDLTLQGNDIYIESYLTEGSATWMILLSSGTTPGVGSRLLQFVHPVATSENTEIVLTDASTVLTVDVDLSASATVTVAAGDPGLVVDWSGLTRDGHGGEFDAADVDTIKVAHFTDTAYLDLAEHFLDVEQDADELWSFRVAGGTSAGLSFLTGDTPWAGIATTGTWALALECSDCSNPAPLLFTQLVACP